MLDKPAASLELTESDKRKLKAIEWLCFDDSQIVDALMQSNIVVHEFLGNLLLLLLLFAIITTILLFTFIAIFWMLIIFCRSGKNGGRFQAHFWSSFHFTTQYCYISFIQSQ